VQERARKKKGEKGETIYPLFQIPTDLDRLTSELGLLSLLWFALSFLPYLCAALCMRALNFSALYPCIVLNALVYC